MTRRTHAARPLSGNGAEDCLAAITELHAAILAGDQVDKLKALAAFQRTYASGLALEIRVTQEFQSRRVRAGFHKILTRLEAFKDMVCETKTGATFELAESWVRSLSAQLAEFAAKEAKVTLGDPGGYFFTGFRRSREKMQELLYNDEPPPWKFHLQNDIDDLDKREKKEAQRTHEIRVAHLRCKIHSRPAHIYMKGPRRNFSIEVVSCCEQFSQQVYEALGPRGWAQERK